MNQKIKILLFLLLCCMVKVAYPQLNRITAAEYFWDTDPGAGNATPLAAASGSFTKSIETALLTTTSLPATGNHVFNVRFKDAYNNWSPLFKTVIVLLPNINTIRTIKVTAAEYFWDSDPGAGNATPMIAFDGAFDESIEEVLKNNVSIPVSVGAHVFNVRVKDAANNWSSTFKTVIDIESNISTIRSIKVTAAEYFWDTDPGAGNGTPMIAFDGAFDESIEEVLKNNVSIPVSVGAHVFNVRVKDAANNWSSTFKTVIDIESNISTIRSIKVTAAEYFWDTDPGAGNATPMIAFDGAFDESIEEVLKNNVSIPVAVGAHVFNVRVKDAANNWSSTFKTVIDIESNISTIRSIKVTAAEYFWDTDPGAGNATPMVAFDGTFNESIEEVLKNNVSIPTTVGAHVLNIRVKDAANNWSTTFKTIIAIESNISTVRAIKVTAGEYFWDNDPGSGNAIAMLAFDGNFNSSFEQIIGGAIPSPVAQGVHVLYTRARDAANNWGPKFGIVVNMDTSINAINVQINGSTSLCQNDLNGIIYNTALIGTNTYNWLITGGAITNGQGTNTVTVNWNPTGPYQLKLIECSTVPLLCDSDIISLNVLNVPTSNATAAICQGQSILLGGAMQTQPGIYNDSYTAANGCDSIVSTTLTVHPVYAITNNVSICQGDSFYVAGQFQTTSGTYVDYLSTTFGCDSTVTTNLSVSPALNYITNTSVCNGDSVLFNGSYFSAAGSYSFTYSTPSGCDSVVTLVLSIDPNYNNITNANICNGDSTLFNGTYYSLAGTYSVTYQSASGCDSILTMQLNIDPTYVNTNNVSINAGDSLFAGGAWQFNAGTYYDSLLTVNGCDSIIITNLGVINGINFIAGYNEISVFPNPFNDEINLAVEKISERNVDIELFDVNGKLICRWDKIEVQTQIILKPKSISSGTYLLNVKASNKIYKAVLIKQ